MASFTIRDVGGVLHSVNLSTDTRYPVAMDGGPAGFNRRRPARDQADLPEQIDAEFALKVMREIVDRVPDPDQRKRLSQGMAEVMDSMTPEMENNETTYGNGDDYEPRPGFTPSPNVGKASPNLSKRPSMDSAIAKSRRSLSARESVERAYPDLRKIGW
jgi:hypothetical protein